VVKKRPPAWCSACGKRLWHTNLTARLAAATDTNYFGETVHIYHCPIRRGWHLARETQPS